MTQYLNFFIFMMNQLSFRKYIAEFLGTFFLVFCGSGAIVFNDETNGIGHFGIAVCFGIVVMIAIYAFSEVSGAHINPAVSLIFAIKGDLKPIDAVFYTVFQVLGGLLGSTFVWYFFPNNEFLGATLPQIEPIKVFALEIFLSFLLILVILKIDEQKLVQGGMIIGGTILMEAIFAGPITGASMNPARSLAPAIISNHLEHLWIYLLAPYLGGIIALLSHKLIR